jgi:hypothetical protein
MGMNQYYYRGMRAHGRLYHSAGARWKGLLLPGMNAMKPTLLLMGACLLAGQVFAAPGVMTRDEDLKASAGAGAGVVGRVTKGATVEILARQGGWTQISGDGKTGWVRILAVKSTAPSGGGAGDVLGLVEAGTPRRDPGKVVAVAGLRGLNEEELKQARYNPAELMQLDRYASDRAEAERFAQAARLQPVKVRYLPNPKQQTENKPAYWGDGSP